MHKATPNYLRRTLKYPERAHIGFYILVSTLTNKPLDVIIRMAFDVAIPESPFFIRADYKTPIPIPEIPEVRTITAQMKSAAKKNILYRYIINKGYSIYWLHTSFGGINQKAWDERGQNPNNFKLLDLIKAAIITKRPLAEVLNYVLFQKETKNIQKSKFYCRASVLEDIPLVIPSKGLKSKKTFKAALKDSSFYLIKKN